MSLKIYDTWSNDLDKSRPYTIQAVNHLSMSGQFLNIENSDNKGLQWLDQNAGIDLIGCHDSKVYGIAARIQYDVSYATFTMRYERFTGSETEYSKRLETIDTGYFHPLFTMQAYVINNRVSSAAIIKTKDLYSFIQSNPEKVYENKSDNLFKYVYWTDIANAGYTIMIRY